MAQFQFTEKEYMRAAFAISRRRLLRTLIIFLLAFALILASLILSGHPSRETLGLGLIGFLLILAFFAFAVWWQLRRAYLGQPVLQALLRVTIDDRQLSYVWERGSYNLPWSGVRRAVETPEFMFLYESPISTRILPKRALSEEEIALIRRKVESLLQ